MVKKIKWPVRYRSEEVECTLCKKPTRDQQAICEDCREINELGKRAKKAAVSGEKKAYYFRQYLDIGKSFGKRIYVSKVFSLLSGEPSHEFQTLPSGAWEDGLILSPVSIHPDSGRPMLSNEGPFASILLTEIQAEICKEFLQCHREQIAEAVKDGQRDGGYFIRKLAEGTLSIDQVNAWHNKAEDKA